MSEEIKSVVRSKPIWLQDLERQVLYGATEQNVRDELIRRNAFIRRLVDGGAEK